MEDSSAHVGLNIDTVIWDLDGTLLDSFGIYQDCLNKVLPAHGLPPASDAILRRNHHGTIEESIVGSLLDMGQDVSEQKQQLIINDFLALDNAYIKNVNDHLFRDAIGLATRLHDANKHQIVVTKRAQGSDRGNAGPRTMISNSLLGQLIDDVVCGDDSDYFKPSKRVLESRFGQGLDELGEILVIGDQYVDAEFAHNLGCDAILVTRDESIAHLDRLDSWQTYVRIVSSLNNVSVN